MTVIGGPNGSGKSNIVDALCFVLGWMKTKTMRAERITDLIYNGGEGRHSAPFAEVSLHFDNGDGSLRVDHKEVIITRRVDRSGKCVYRMNRKRVSRQEIVDLLGESLSLGEYNFIMQGDVGRFVRMDPLERRGIIDDFAGIAEYDEKKEKSLSELQRVETNLTAMSGVLNEISANVERLRSEKEGAILYRELKSRLELAKGMLLRIESERCERALRELENEKNEISGKLAKLRQRSKKLKAGVGLLETEEKRLDDLEREQDVHTLATGERLRERVATLKEEMAHLEGERADIEDRLPRVQKEFVPPVELFSRFQELQADFNELSDPLIEGKNLTTLEIRTGLRELRDVLGNIRTALEGIRAHLTHLIDGDQVDRSISLHAQHAHLLRRIAELREKIASAQTELKKISTCEAQALKSLNRLRDRRKRVREKLAKLRRRDSIMTEKIGAIEGELADHRVEEERLRVQLEEKKKGLGRTDLERNLKSANPSELSREVEALESKLSSLEPVNFKAIQEFDEVRRRHENERAKYEKLVAEKRTILEFMEEIERKKTKAFMRSFNEISKNFGAIFSELSPGGSARLVLGDPAKPLESGMEIEARPGGKEVLRPSSMSGGEKALTALAFIFALQRTRPAGFYIFDEIDAHLDVEKLPRVAETLKRYARDSQIVVVTLKDSMMSVADRLFGVAMEGGVSKLLSIELRGYAG